MHNPLRDLVSPPPPTVEQLLESVGLPPDFLSRLMTESDWSFIIKLHAVFESVLSSLIVRSLGSRGIDDQVAHLDFNNAKSGKVAFARGLGLLGKPAVTFLRGLSELRNMLVHDIGNVSFDLKAHVLELNRQDLKKFRSEFGWAMLRLEGGEKHYLEALKKEPKMLVYVAAYSCLLELQFQITGHQRAMLVQALIRHTAK
jgi:hypothetical protein